MRFAMLIICRMEFMLFVSAPFDMLRERKSNENSSRNNQMFLEQYRRGGIQSCPYAYIFRLFLRIPSAKRTYDTTYHTKPYNNKRTVQCRPFIYLPISYEYISRFSLPLPCNFLCSCPLRKNLLQVSQPFCPIPDEPWRNDGSLSASLPNRLSYYTLFQ